jgi:cytoskeletal protein RodZ
MFLFHGDYLRVVQKEPEKLNRRGVGGFVAVALLIMGVLIGISGYYVATTYQTKTITLTATTTHQETTTQTQTSTETFTSVVSSTTTQTSFITSSSTTSVYPVPTNVTVAFVQDDGAYQYEIEAGPNVLTSTPSGPLSIPLTNLFEGEQVKITASSVGDRIGETVTVELFVNNQMVQQSTTGTGSSPAQIAYTV